MESSLSFGIPANLIVNGKLYSRGFGIINDGGEDSDPLQFKISFQDDPANLKPGIKLQITALRPAQKQENPRHIQEYEANLFFPATGLINYSFETPSEVTHIERGFLIPPKQNLAGFRCFNFGAKEVVIVMDPVPSLRTESMEVDLARLINSAKNVNAIPEAVLEIFCLMPDADDTLDSNVHAMERSLFGPPPSPSAFATSPPKSSPPKPNNLPTGQPTKHLTMDSLLSMYKNKPKPGSASSSTLGSPFGSEFHDVPFKSKNFSRSQDSSAGSSPHEKKEHLPKPRGPSIPSTSKNEFQENNPPKLADQHNKNRVCFNCYAVNHRETECPQPKKGEKGHSGLSLRLKREKSGEEGEEKVSPTPQEKWFCEKCKKLGHTHWLCPGPKKEQFLE